MNISNNITAPCLLIAAMIILILFQSVFFTNKDVVYTEPEIPSQSESVSDISGDESIGEYIILNDVKYTPDKFFILAVISNICAFLLPAVFYIRLKGSGYSKNLKFSLPKLRYLPLTIYMFLILISGTVLINSLLFYFSGAEANNIESVIPFFFNTGGNPIYDMGILVSFVLLPAFCEEIFFRSVLASEYEKYGAFCAVVMTAASFAMSHFSLKFFPSYFFAAVIFYVLVKITNSVWFSMIIHAGYNFCSIYLFDELLGVLKFEQNRIIFIFITAAVFMVLVCLGLNNLETIYYKKAYNNEPFPVYFKKDKRGNPVIIRLFRSFFSPVFTAALIIFFVYVLI